VGDDTSSWLKVDGDTATVMGHLGVTELKPVQDALRALGRQGHKTITIDLVRADYMSSSYLGVVVGVAAEMEKSGGRVTVRAQGQILRLLQLAGLDKVLTIEAYKGFAGPPPPS